MTDIGNKRLSRSYSFRGVPHVNASGPSPLRRAKSDSALHAKSSALIIWRLKQDNISPKQLETAKIIIQDRDNVKMRADGCVSLRRKGLDGETRILPDGRTRHHYSDKKITGTTKQGLPYTRYPDKSVLIKLSEDCSKYISPEGHASLRYSSGETIPLDEQGRQKKGSQKQEKSSSRSISPQEKVLGEKRKRFEEQKQKSKKALGQLEQAAEDARAIYDQLEAQPPAQKKNIFRRLGKFASRIFRPFKKKKA